MGTGNLSRVPLAAVHPGSQAMFRDGTVWVLKKGPVGTGPAWSVFVKIRFIEKPGVQDEGGRHVAKHSSDPRVACPEVNVQVRDLVRVVGIVVPLCPAGVHYSEKIRLIDRTSPKQYTRSLVLPSWTHETWSGAPCEGIIHTLRIELL